MTTDKGSLKNKFNKLYGNTLQIKAHLFTTILTVFHFSKCINYMIKVNIGSQFTFNDKC